jgi:hypothetical protein
MSEAPNFVEQRDALVREIELKRKEIDKLERKITRLKRDMFELACEGELIALKACGLDVGQSVRMIKSRFAGREATIEDAVVWSPGGLPTEVGAQPTILVSVPGTRARAFTAPGHHWEKIG